MSRKYDLLIDSDAFISDFLEKDSNHKLAGECFDSLEQKKMSFLITSSVVEETVTVLSHRVGQKLVVAFLARIERGNIPILSITDGIRDEVLKFIAGQNRRGLSFTDCANFVVARNLGVKTVFSFDKFYPKVGLKLYNGNMAKA